MLMSAAVPGSKTRLEPFSVYCLCAVLSGCTTQTPPSLDVPEDLVDAARFDQQIDSAIDAQTDADQRADGVLVEIAGDGSDGSTDSATGLVHTPQDWRSLQTMLSIRWELGTSLPQGIQESAAAIVNGRLYNIGGYCQGVSEPVPQKPNKFPQGFTARNDVLSLGGGSWSALPPLPATARQAHASAVWNGQIIIAGGFNYTAPYSYGDVYVFDTNTQRWDSLAPLPNAVADGALAVVGDTLYALGGADYDSLAWHTERDRTGAVQRLGAKFYQLDLRLGRDARWQALAELPGTPRFLHAVSVVDGKIYVLGGGAKLQNDPVFRDDYCNVMDSWRYDPVQARWHRLRDLPMANGWWPRGALTYHNRYIILPGGYARSCAVVNGTVIAAYGSEGTTALRSYGVEHDVLVFDTQTNTFGRATNMPIGNTGPATVVQDNVIHVLGGETGRAFYRGEYFPNQPDLYLRGTITESSESLDPMGLAFFSVWPMRTVTPASPFIVAGTCHVNQGDVFLLGPDNVPSERRVPCNNGLFELTLPYPDRMIWGNRSMALEQLSRGARVREQDISVYFPGM